MSDNIFSERKYTQLRSLEIYSSVLITHSVQLKKLVMLLNLESSKLDHYNRYQKPDTSIDIGCIPLSMKTPQVPNVVMKLSSLNKFVLWYAIIYFISICSFMVCH